MATDAGIEICSVRRNSASVSGSTTIAASARETSRFSVWANLADHFPDSLTKEPWNLSIETASLLIDDLVSVWHGIRQLTPASCRRRRRGPSCRAFSGTHFLRIAAIRLRVPAEPDALAAPASSSPQWLPDSPRGSAPEFLSLPLKR